MSDDIQAILIACFSIVIFHLIFLWISMIYDLFKNWDFYQSKNKEDL